MTPQIRKKTQEEKIEDQNKGVKGRLLPLVFFGLVILLSGLDVLAPDKVFSPYENRYLEEKPTLSLEALIDGSFTQNYETYIADQFVFRDQWMQAKIETETLLLKSENKSVIFGKEGYLFHKYLELGKNYEKNLGYLEDFIAAHPQKEIILTLAPASYQILDDKTPYGLYNIDQDPWLDDFEDRLSSGQVAGQAQVVDLRPSLRQHKSDYIYYKTDHHWTTSGAYYAYRDLAAVLGLRAKDLESFEKKKVHDFQGTFYAASPRQPASTDTIWYDPSLDQDLSVRIDGEEKGSLYDLDQLDGRDKYALFLHNNPARLTIKNKYAEKKDSLVVFKDSYANSMIPFLSQHFARIEVIDLRYYLGDIQALLKETKGQILFCYNLISFAEDKNLVKLPRS